MKSIKFGFLVIGFLVAVVWTHSFQSSDKGNLPYTFQVLFKKDFVRSGPGDLKLKKYVLGVERFDHYPSEYFSRLYDVTVASESDVEAIERLPFVEGVHRPVKAKLMAIYPPKTGTFATDDTFANHQWALKNIYMPGDERVDFPEAAKGYLIRKDLTDVQVKFLSSRPADGSQNTYDLQYTNEVRDLAFGEGPEIVVAVIDSGVDWTHPELKDHLFRKEDECRGPGIPRPGKDVDGNGYENDCMGWNFTAAKSSPARNRPFDTLGHGTHITGILSAASNNGLGVSGISSRIKIMPLKVVGYGTDIVEPNEFDSNEFDGFTSQIAKAIRYATHEGAQVINLSLGWPRVANIDIVQEAVREALAAGLTIVAASGNNGHTSKIMPCSMEGVICVGSINNDGTVSDFSNYGGHVDILAPGHGILSTWPLQMTPSTFDVNGYEILNGTSQATPFVVGLVALMKLKFPEISSNEILARLITTARPVYTELDEPKVPGVPYFDSVAGTIQYASALADDWSEKAVIPDLKGSPLIKYLPSNLSAQISVPIKALGADLKNVTVQLESKRKDLILTQKSFQIEQIPVNEPETLVFNVQLENAFVDSEWNFDLVLSADGLKDKRIHHQVYFARDLETDPSVVRVNRPELGEGTFSYRPVVDIRRILSNPSVFTSRLDEETGGIQIQIHTVNDNAELQSSAEIFVPNLHLRPNGLGGPQFQLFAEDVNEDGKPDWVVVGIYSNEEGDFVQLSWFKNDFTPLYGQQSHWSMKYEHAAPEFKDIKYMEMTVKGLGKVKTPVFVTDGAVPDQDKGSKMDFLREDGVSQGLYVVEPYLSNGKVLGRARKIDSNTFKQYLRKQLNIREVDRLSIVGLLTQSASDFAKSKVSVLYSYGHANQFTYAVAAITEGSLYQRTMGVKKFQTKRHLSENQMLSVMDLSGPDPKSNQGTMFVNTLQHTRLRSVYFDHNKNWKFQQELRYNSTERSELILGAVRGFTKNGVATLFLETGYRTIALVGKNKNNTKDYKRKINRSTFLPGYFFSEIMQPTAILTPRGHEPALYVDATAILSGNIILWQVGEDGAKAPAKFNLQIPGHCRTIEKMYWKAKRADTVIINCSSEEESYFLLYPLVE